MSNRGQIEESIRKQLFIIDKEIEEKVKLLNYLDFQIDVTRKQLNKKEIDLIVEEALKEINDR